LENPSRYRGRKNRKKGGEKHEGRRLVETNDINRLNKLGKKGKQRASSKIRGEKREI